jgi:hypothetical protein
MLFLILMMIPMPILMMILMPIGVFNSVPDPLHFLTVPDADLDPRTRFSDF